MKQTRTTPGPTGTARRLRTLGVALAGATLCLGTAPGARAEDETPFDEAHIFFELNDTDGDLGIHALVDGDAWKQLEIESPREDRMLRIDVTSRLRRQGLTEIFFESDEPSFDELDPRQFFRRFPAGTYEVEGITLDGEELESEVELTHLMPAPPEGVEVSGVPAGNDDVDCEEQDPPVVTEPVVVSWEPVAFSHPEIGRTDEPIEVVKYQLVVEREEPELLVYSVDLPPDVTEMEVPSDFIALGEEFKFEILVREASGNQTAVESCFAVE
jgi:hypothetical protein